jgi:hypothetical protein
VRPCASRPAAGQDAVSREADAVIHNRRSMFRSRRTAAFAICLLLAVAHTWPLALDPGRHSRNDNADAELNEWIMAWVAHQLPRDPLHLFEANIFYPAHDVLAFSEPLIAPALMGAPLAWLGASPVLVHNVILILGFALTAFAGFVLIEAWTGSFMAGLVAGSLLAFNTHTLTRIAHIQAVHLYGLPLALLAADRLMRGGNFRTTLALALWVALMAYTSGYLVVFAAFMLAIAFVTRAPEWWPRAKPVMTRVAAAAVVAAIAILPVYLPYRRVAREQHMVRTLDIVKDYSATLKGYLATAGSVHFSTWSAAFFKDPVDSFFPGIVIIGLAALAVLLAFRRRTDVDHVLRGRVVMLLAIALAGLVLSLGTATPIYGWAFSVFPPMQGLRAAARFGNLFLLGIALLGGLGLALWRPRPAIGLALVALVNLESLRAPFTYVPFEGIPGIYRLLADEPGHVVLVEQPFFPRAGIFLNSPYVLASTAHWRPLMNGYSGYTPATYQRYADSFWYFPQPWAIQAMKDAGVTHVVVHPAGFHKERQAVVPVLEKRADFELMAIGRADIRLYRLKK